MLKSRLNICDLLAQHRNLQLGMCCSCSGICLLLQFLLIFIYCSGLSEQLLSKPCVKKDFGDGIVCICNATYCDTIEQNIHLNSTNYAIYRTTKSGDRLLKNVYKFKKQQSTHSGEYSVHVNCIDNANFVVIICIYVERNTGKFIIDL